MFYVTREPHCEGGHTLNLEEPEAYNASILEFLQRVKEKNK